MSFPGSHDDVKERLRQSIDICDLIGEQIDLTRQGRGFVGLCPWHDDSRPSLQVNPERQTWKCWVCDIGGDVFSFVMQREGIGFREALEMLAERAGVSLSDAPQRRVQPGSVEDKQTLYQAMSWACNLFHEYLTQASEGEAARAYLQQRQISRESIEHFRIGYSPPDWEWLVRRADQTPYSLEVLQAVGLLFTSQKNQKLYDRFRGRVLFPIHDTQQRPIAIGGRILPNLADEKTAKYINSPETRLFSKSEQLYGLNLARDSVSKQRSIVVMEGYTDVIGVQQHGFENVVAVLGTALGPRHIRLIKRYADRIVLLLDGDEAGQRRANEILDLFVTHHIDMRIATLPAGLDPCDFVNEHGAQALQDVIDGASDAWDHKIAMETRGLDPIRDTHRAHQALESLIAIMARNQRSTAEASQRLREQQLLNRLSREFQVEESQLRERLQAARREQRPRLRSPDEAVERPRKSYELEPTEQALLELMLQHATMVPAVLQAIRVEQLVSEFTKSIFRKFEQLIEDGVQPTFDRLLLSYDEPEVKTWLVKLDDAGRNKSEADPNTVFEDLCKAYERRRIQDSLRQGQAALESTSMNEDEQLDLLKDLLRKRQELIDG